MVSSNNSGDLVNYGLYIYPRAMLENPFRTLIAMNLIAY